MKRLIFLLLLRFPHIHCLMGDTQSAIGTTGASGVVFIDNGLDFNTPWFCTGALLNRQIVLTIADCQPIRGFHVTITVGATHFQDEGIHFYPNRYLLLGRRGPVGFRLCLIKLDRPVEYSPYVLPFSLPNVGEVIHEKEIFEVYGYGAVSEEPSQIYYHSDQLLVLKMPTRPPGECDKIYRKPNTDSQLLCVGFYRGPRLMYYDHAVPLVRDRVLYGMGIYPQVGHYQPPVNSSLGWPSYFINVAHATAQIYEGINKLLG